MNKIIDKIMLLDIYVYFWFMIFFSQLFHNFFCHYFEIFFAQKEFKCKDGFPFDLDRNIKVDLSKSTR